MYHTIRVFFCQSQKIRASNITFKRLIVGFRLHLAWLGHLLYSKINFFWKLLNALPTELTRQWTRCRTRLQGKFQVYKEKTKNGHLVYFKLELFLYSLSNWVSFPQKRQRDGQWCWTGNDQKLDIRLIFGPNTITKNKFHNFSIFDSWSPRPDIWFEVSLTTLSVDILEVSRWGMKKNPTILNNKLKTVWDRYIICIKRSQDNHSHTSQWNIFSCWHNIQ